MKNIPFLRLFHTGTISNTSLIPSFCFLILVCTTAFLLPFISFPCWIPTGSPQTLKHRGFPLWFYVFSSFGSSVAYLHSLTLSASCSAAQPGASFWGFAHPPPQQPVPALLWGLHRQPGPSRAGCSWRSLQENPFLLGSLGGGIVAGCMSWQWDGICRSCPGCLQSPETKQDLLGKLIRPVRGLHLLYNTTQRCCFCFKY